MSLITAYEIDAPEYWERVRTIIARARVGQPFPLVDLLLIFPGLSGACRTLLEKRGEIMIYDNRYFRNIGAEFDCMFDEGLFGGTSRIVMRVNADLSGRFGSDSSGFYLKFYPAHTLEILQPIYLKIGTMHIGVDKVLVDNPGTMLDITIRRSGV